MGNQKTLAFLELLQLSIGTREQLSRVPSVPEWDNLLDEAQRQAVVGVLVSGIEKLPNEQRPPKVLLLQWIGVCQQIEAQNRITTNTCINVCQRLDKDGYNACVLKGQSNYRYYPAEMRNRRSCGDVDVWVIPKADCKYPVKEVVEYVDANFNMDVLCWLHNGFTDESGVPVEVHFRPSFMSEPCKNRLTEDEARWITGKMDSIFVKEDSYKGLPDEERKRRRGEEVAPILHEIKQRLDILKGEKSAPDAWKHPGLYEAVEYAIREWTGIQNYLLTGSGDYTNNNCEREMRIVATLRNNSLFWGSHTSVSVSR